VVDVEAEHLAQQRVAVLAVVLRVAAAPAVAERDQEEPVRVEGEGAAVVVRERLVDVEDPDLGVRIDIDGGAGTTAERPYGIPAGNPFADGSRGRPEIWLTGLRNPWRMSFDRATGDLWIGDVGQNAWEEVDVQRAGAAPGTNFGWNRMEGTHCFEPEQGCEDPALTLPVSDYGHDLGCTVIGGNVYRGSDQAALAGGYVFADYCSGRVFAIDAASDAYRSPVEVAATDRNISAFGEDEAGELFVTDIGGGELLRVVATAR
jgi:glucose/arabinose dehydrogenase